MEILVETIAEQPVLGIRTRTRVEEIGDHVGRLLPELMAAAGDRCAGPPLARWHEWDGEEGEMEVAVPVRGEAAAGGRAEASVLPGGRAVVATYLGSYDGLKDAWTRVRAWMEKRGLEGRAPPWEVYVGDCTATPPEDLETRIVWPCNGS